MTTKVIKCPILPRYKRINIQEYHQKLLMQKNIIYIIGYMGSGKSIIGSLLAHKIGYEYMDTDVEIVKQEGRSIADIFTTKGEKYFRNLEKNILRNIKVDNIVISCGGGMPCYNRNISFMKKKGLVVWLKVSMDDIVERIAKDENRPLVKGKTKNELRRFINHHRKNRIPFYNKADIKVWSKGSVEKVTEKIVNYLRKID